MRKLVPLAVLVLVGLGSKFYRGPFEAWVQGSFGGFVYVVFWCLFFALVFPGARPWAVVLAVLVVTCILEFLQLWHPPLLEAVRSCFLGRALLGHAFHASDFPYYFAGAAVAWLHLHIQRRDSSLRAR